MNPQDQEQNQHLDDDDTDDDHGVIIISDSQIESLVKNVKYCILAIAVAFVVIGIRLWA
jgi:hypothetical protein